MNAEKVTYLKGVLSAAHIASTKRVLNIEQVQELARARYHYVNSPGVLEKFYRREYPDMFDTDGNLLSDIQIWALLGDDFLRRVDKLDLYKVATKIVDDDESAISDNM